MTTILDGLRNLVAGLGSSRDKAASASYYLTIPDDQQLQAAYRTSGLARKIVDIPAQDACREWREWQAGADEISAIEAEESRLRVQGLVRQAKILARLNGGAAIYIGTGEVDPSKPLNPETIRRDGLQYLTVLPKSRVAAGDIVTDPRLPGFGKPSFYQLDAGVRVHPSRLVVLHGRELPEIDMASAASGWGDSVLTSTLEAVKAVDSVAANILALTYEASVDVISVPNFSENLRSGGPEYERNVIQRFQLALQAKSNTRALLLDAEEEYAQKSASFSSLDALWDRFMQTVSAVSDIPMTRLFGQSPAGLNATGEGDQKNYHDAIKVIQTLEMQPAMAVLDECLIRSALGSRPEEVFYNWRPLGQPSAKERAEVADKITSAFERVYRMEGLVPEEPLAKALINSLTESGIAPGLEADAEEYFAVNASEDPPDDELAETA